LKKYSDPIALKKIKENVDRSLMLVTALACVIGYDKSSKIVYFAMDNDRVDDSAKMITAYCSLFGESDRLVERMKRQD
jgi:fumarate hydratase, class II